MAIELTENQIKTYEKNNLLKNTVYNRIKRGWSIDRAIHTPVDKRAWHTEGMWVGNTYVTEDQIAEAGKNGISKESLYQRMRSGHTLEQAISTPKKKHREDLRKYSDAEMALAEKNGISMNTVRVRINAGWDKHRALTEPIHQHRVNDGVVSGKVTAAQREEAQLNGVSVQLLHYRIKSGWDVDEAINTPPQKKYYAGSPGNRLAYGREVTAEEIDHAENNGINWETLKKRIKNGMSVEEAINKPLAFEKRSLTNKEENEALATVGRIKYLNRTEFKDDPMPYMKSDLKKLSALGISVDEVEEIEA